MSADSREFLVLHEFVKAARERLDPGPWDYLIGATETETTLRRNRHAIDALAFRPRVLRDVSEIDLSGSLLGMRTRIPVMLAPIGSLQDFDPGGGATAAKAAAEFGVVHVQSSRSEPGLEGTAAAADGPKIFQLYVRGTPDWVDDHVRRAEQAGYRSLCLTVDTDLYSRRERDLAKRHVTTARKQPQGDEHQARFSWRDVDRIRGFCGLPMMLKGIATAEDAALALEHGMDAVWVSNHGGRQLDHGRGSIEVLPEVVRAVEGRIPVIVDGGFMRGTDVVKAMALGASAVAIGRLFGLAIAADGQRGVVRMLEILEHEIRTCLGLLGVTSMAALGPDSLHPAPVVTDPRVLSAFPLLDEGY
ncbi:MAG: alpha-hydroxy-acid oxidizing protein [Ectothiorhodospiraceae bacterium]|nr:alpha-hydroxy-acid oxidizing protein [Chromatiales bacterium]MCP5154677.1 alpha-hydroxy-acid oxidizing protein [Ectothiorhodospiraceae bacterium]